MVLVRLFTEKLISLANDFYKHAIMALQIQSTQTELRWNLNVVFELC